MNTYLHRIGVAQPGVARPAARAALASLVRFTLTAILAIAASLIPVSATGAQAAARASGTALSRWAISTAYSPAIARGANAGPAAGAFPARRAAQQLEAPHAAHSPASTELITLYPGDTLCGLAVRYHTSVTSLQQLNRLGTSTVIYAGATFRVPAAPYLAQRRTISPAMPASAAAAMAVAFARAQLGKPYLWGGTGVGGYDCSGLIMRAWQAGGVDLPRDSYAQAGAGVRVRRDQLVPGDLVFSNGYGHVELYIGGGEVIQAPHTGAAVEISPLPPAEAVDAYVHINPMQQRGQA